MKRNNVASSQLHQVNVRRKTIREDRAAALAELSDDQERRNAVYKTDPALFAKPRQAEVRRNYTPKERQEILARFDELREQGVKLLDMQGLLGVSTATIYTWRQQLGLDRGQQQRRETMLDQLLWGPQT